MQYKKLCVKANYKEVKCQQIYHEYYNIASLLTSCVYFFSVGDFLPPPPPPLDDSSALPSISGNFPPPPPLDEEAFKVQVRAEVKVMFIAILGSS